MSVSSFAGPGEGSVASGSGLDYGYVSSSNKISKKIAISWSKIANLDDDDDDIKMLSPSQGV